MKALLVAMLAGSALAATAQAKDILPLKRGTYVATIASCANPPLAVIVTFTGDRFLFPHFSDCTVSSVRRTGHAYKVAESCQELQNDASDPMIGTYRVLSPTIFLMQNQQSPDWKYRWCSP